MRLAFGRARHPGGGLDRLRVQAVGFVGHATSERISIRRPTTIICLKVSDHVLKYE